MTLPSNELPGVIARVRAGVVCLALFNGSIQVASGSGFLLANRLVTNSHVIRGAEFDAVEITFGDNDINPIEPIRLAREDLYSLVRDESSGPTFDYAVLDLSNEPELAGRFAFELASAENLANVGDQVLFFGFPFGSTALTSHVGYISAEYQEGPIHVLQIDGSINPRNSGGPLVHVRSDKVIGIVTRTQTGLERDFDELVEAIEANEQVLSQQTAVMTIGGINPVEATRVTMTILGRVARNLKRSANVGIGWAFCTEHLLQQNPTLSA